MNSSSSRFGLSSSRNNNAAVLSVESPIEEFNMLLDRIEFRIMASRESYRDTLIEASKPKKVVSTTSRIGGIGRFLNRGRSNDGMEPTINTPTRVSANANVESVATAAVSPSASPNRQVDQSNRTDPIADFIPFPHTDEFVEDLRRIAELCVIGENFVTRLQKKEDTAKLRSKKRWAAARDALLDDVSESEPAYEEGCPDLEKLQLFDLFFERNALSMIVDLLHGELFDFDNYPREKNGEKYHSDEKDVEEKPVIELNPQIGTLLPPLAIATQALQSISILIQNVSRATSLYVILSNNCINKLIDFPLHLYTIAEKRRLVASMESQSLPAIFTSPQITEISTHFVTFLKSLALRMNAETLQFFLKYDSHLSSSVTTDDILHPTGANDGNIEFPLYARSLEFCAAHQDSFVRTTALNICLNTLRLTTIDDKKDDVEQCDDTNSTPQLHSLPDGILHNAKPLPFHERLVIAQYTCVPSRVEFLISPIFTKLAERWSALDEHIRIMDSSKRMGFVESNDDIGLRNERVTKAKETVRCDRLIRGFKEIVADLQDELLLLDDVFKVGLTVLNEQLVETMLATFVYPMLLQPLLIYVQRFTSSVDEDRLSFSDHPFGRISADLSDVERSLSEVAGPAKAALFTLASVFQFLSNRPLRRLLFVVLLHPLSPDATSAPSVRSKLEVATVAMNGQTCIRLDTTFSIDESLSNERLTYDFGTDPENRRRSRSSDAVSDDNEACTFVLAPALAEILEFRGDDLSLVARTKPNPYRLALIKCIAVPDDMADVRELAICTFDAILSSFQSRFVSCVLFGSDLKMFIDDVPADERNLDSIYAHDHDDRGIGGSVGFESRHSLPQPKNGSVGTNLVNEIVSSLCNCVIYATRVACDDWILGFNEIASHALLLAVRHHKEATQTASKILENRYRQAALSLATVPSGGLTLMGGSSLNIPGSPDANDSEYEESMFENFLNLVFFDQLHCQGSPMIDEFVGLKEPSNLMSENNFSVPIAGFCDPEILTKKVVKFLQIPASTTYIREFNNGIVDERRESTRALVKVDALLTLLRKFESTTGFDLNQEFSQVAKVTSGGAVKLSVSDRKNYQSVFANVSSTFINFLLHEEVDEEILTSESVVDLDSNICIPCVCEVSGSTSHFFNDIESKGIVSEGVTWQSLYLVIYQGKTVAQLVLAQALPATGGSVGRVISACLVERILMERELFKPDDESPARRLSIYHKWFDLTPPPLFLFDSMPDSDGNGNFLASRPLTSRLDVWFENEFSAKQAYNIISRHIFMAKAQRGKRVLKFLDPRYEQNYILKR